MSLTTIFENILNKETSADIIDKEQRETQSRNNHKALSMANEPSDLRKLTDFMDKVSELAKNPPLEKGGDEKCP